MIWHNKSEYKLSSSSSSSRLYWNLWQTAHAIVSRKLL